jgi:hypothetical protein
MKTRVEKHVPASLLEFRSIIETLWDSLAFETIEKLLDSLPERCQKVILNNGLTITN